MNKGDMQALSKIPPQSQEAERATLGSIILGKEALLKVADFLKADDFYYEQHSIIYQAMLDLFAKHMPIDVKYWQLSLKIMENWIKSVALLTLWN